MDCSGFEHIVRACSDAAGMYAMISVMGKSRGKTSMNITIIIFRPAHTAI
jgi:hypothetical protein